MRLLQTRRTAALAMAATLLAACGGATPTAPAAAAGESMVVLTVTGAIGETNRGPLDEFDDAFLGHKGMKFEKAYAFTLADLAALEQRELSLKRPNWPRTLKLRGPAFKDVMAKVKAEGGIAMLQALDGYQSEFNIADLQSDSVLLAIEADGKPIPLGGHGPTWLVYPAGVVPGDDGTGDAGLAWSVFHIDVQAQPAQ